MADDSMNKTVVPFKRPIRWSALRADEAECLIKERAVDTKNIIFTIHAYDRVDERSVLQSDVYRILREGYVDTLPVRNDKDDWQVVMKKRIRGGREVGVVTAIFRETDQLLIITVMWVD